MTIQMKNNPYVGPRPFERGDRGTFFGRTRETRDLLALIMAERVVLFYAQSGAGKTSLLNTQIIPAWKTKVSTCCPWRAWAVNCRRVCPKRR